MKQIPDNFYHIYNRGNNKQRIFFVKKNYSFFLDKIRTHLIPYSDLICYCLMPNHFHLLIHTPIKFDDDKFTNNLKIFLSSYTRAINIQNKTTGSLFQQHSRIKCLTVGSKRSENYAFVCFHYIHQNPLKGGLVKKIEDWEFSSFREYIGLRKKPICNKAFAIETLGLPSNPEEFYKMSYKIISEDKGKNNF
jgi:REP element-mobilizing transposase RayT